MKDEDRRRLARRRGRLATIIVFYVVVVGFTLFIAGNITRQLWASPADGGPAVTCDAGLASLVRAIDRAKNAVSTNAPGDEDIALQLFRSSLSPEWTQRDAIAVACRASPDRLASLDTIERLRYAEEHATRLEAAELAPLRRKVHEIMANLGK